VLMSAERTWIRYAGYAGFIGVFITFYGALTALFPVLPSGATAAIRDYYASHRVAVTGGAYLTGLGAPFLLWFISALRAALARAEGGAGVLAWLSFSGGVATTVLALFPSICAAVLALNPQRDDGVLRAVFDLGNLTFALVFFVWAAFVAAASVLMIRTGVLARWLGWFGIVVTVVFLIYPAGIVATIFNPGGLVDLIAYALGMIWMFITAGWLVRHPETAAP
jgi:hypothetical protein